MINYIKCCFLDFNPRHVRKKTRDSITAKKMFDLWHEDSVATVQKVVKHDWDKLLVSRLVPDPEELRKIKNELICNFSMLKEVFHFLQSKSKSWPAVEVRQLIDLLVGKIGLGEKDHFTRVAV